jgi:hypothetical protein
MNSSLFYSEMAIWYFCPLMVMGTLKAMSEEELAIYRSMSI